VSVTVRGEEVTAQPIPRSLADGDLLVSVRDDEWTYIENTETGATELYARSADPTQQEDCSSDPTPTQRDVLGAFAEVADAHAATLRTGETNRGDEMDDDLGARLEALGYR
jgi:hypothetical protein